MLRVVRDEFFPFLRTEIQQHCALGKFLKAANCLIPSGNLLVRAVNAIDGLPLTQGDFAHGFDFDSTMLRIAAMNLLLHGIEHPAISLMPIPSMFAQ